MNIFRILSSNDGSINEPNVSSFLAYLLNPNEDHGISGLLLQEILNEFITINSTFLDKIQYCGRITDLSNYSGFSINIMPELTVNIENESKKKRRDIDIVLEISDNKSNELYYSICLENKITDASINKTDSQLEDELFGLEKFYHDNDLHPEIFIIYLTPSPSETSANSFDKLKYDKKCHLFWDNHDGSIFNKLLKIFDNENHGLIDPINSQSAYLIKSFLSFIKTNFKSYVEERKEKLEKRNYGKPVIDHLNDYIQTLNLNKEYTVSEIKNGFSNYVWNQVGIELHKPTRDAHIKHSIVNERNRGHYNVKRPDDERRNLFYYVDDNHKKVKIFHLNIKENIRIYYRYENEITYVKLKELNQTE